jgi:hypothetical protein
MVPTSSVFLDFDFCLVVSTGLEECDKEVPFGLAKNVDSFVCPVFFSPRFKDFCFLEDGVLVDELPLAVSFLLRGFDEEATAFALAWDDVDIDVSDWEDWGVDLSCGLEVVMISISVSSHASS